MFWQAAVAVILSVSIGELAKVVLQLIRREKLKALPLGGFVSTHSAAVSSLFAAVYFETGLSLLLLICGVFGGIVLRDAYGVRWEVTRHSLALNSLTNTKDYAKTGHEKKEVLLGVILGIAVALAVYLLIL